MKTYSTRSPVSTKASFVASDAAETDQALMARIQSGDDAALAALARRYDALLRSIVRRVLRHEADVDEVAQDVILEIWNHADSFCEEKGKLQAWIVTLARRRAIDRVRRQVSYQRATDRHRTLVESQAPAFHDSADSAAHDGDLVILFRRILATIPAAQRQALELSFHGGFSQREIARATGLPLGTVKTRIELGLRKVRTAISAMGGSSAWLTATA